MTRRFVAIGVGASVRDRLARSLAEVRDHGDGRAWTEPLGWHVTLAFVGELADERLHELRRAVVRGVDRALVDEPSTTRLTLGAPGRFSTRVAYVSVLDDPSGGIAALGAAIQSEIAASGLPVHEQPLRPHVTLARARRSSVVTDVLMASITQAIRTSTPTELRWPVTAVGLWSAGARAATGPARYGVDAEVSLTR